MVKNLLWLSLLAAWPVALCRGQEEPGAGREQPRAARPAAEVTIPELLTAAQQFRAAKRYNEAVNVLGVVLQKDEANIDALRLLGDIAWETKNVELARTNWLRVREIQPNDFGANFGLGRMYLRSGVYRNAMHYLEIAASVTPPEHAGEVFIWLAQAYDGSGLRTQALEVIQKAIASDPNSFDAWRVLIALRTRTAATEEDFDQALTDVQRLKQIAAGELRQGTALERLQRLQLAYQMELQVLYAFRQLIFEPNPDGKLSDRVRPGEEKRAAATLSKIADVMLRQAELNHRLSRFAIVEFAARAVEYDGGSNPSTLMVLGLLQKETGQGDRAIESFRRVLELDPGNDSARSQLEGLELLRPAPATTTQPTEQTP